MKQFVQLGPVQETLLIPLFARADETRKSQPIIRDPKAVEIVDALDFDFRQFKQSQRTLLGCCLRGLQFDDWCRSFLTDHPTGTVVELGAGLNTRFERVDNGQCRWFDLDLPDSMELRQRFFAETERRRFLSASVSDLSWMAEVAATGGPWLFIAEAVLVYLPEAEVRRTIAQIADHFPGSSLAFDTIHTRMKEAEAKDKAFQNAQPLFDWAIDDIEQLTQWDSRYVIKDRVTLGDVAIRHRFELPLRVLFFGKLFAWMHPKFAKSYHLNWLKW